MRVSLAVQILSKSVSEGIKHMISIGFFDTEEEKETAKNASIFAAKMNDLFDMLNAKERFDHNIFKRGISTQNIEHLRSLFDYVMSLKHTGKKVFWINGLQQTVKGVILLFEEKQATDDSFCLMTRRLNQDALENMFGVIRAKGGNNRNPTLLDFLRIMSRLLTSSLKVSFQNSNCELEDGTKVEILDHEMFDSRMADDYLQSNDEV